MMISEKGLEQSAKSREGHQRGGRLPYKGKRISVKEVAELAGVSKDTVSVYCLQGVMSVEDLIKRFKK